MKGLSLLSQKWTNDTSSVHSMGQSNIYGCMNGIPGRDTPLVVKLMAAGLDRWSIRLSTGPLPAHIKQILKSCQRFAILCNILTWLSVVIANSLLPVIHNSKPGINDNPLGGGRAQLAAQTVRNTLRGAERLSTMHEHTETHYSIFAHKQGRQEKKRLCLSASIY